MIDEPERSPEHSAARRYERFLTGPYAALTGATIAIFLIFVLGNWVVLPMITRGTDVRVPDLYSLDVAEAKLIVEEKGLVFINDSSDFVSDESVPVDHVVMQSPVRNTFVKLGRSVRVTISRGAQAYGVPNVRGISPNDARIRLEQAQFQVGAIRYVLRSTDDRSEQYVQEQFPPAGTQLKRGDKVSLVVSIVPAMPNLIGRNMADARQELERLGIQVGSIDMEPREGVAPGTIINQSIAPQARIVAGDKVDLITSEY
jgi:serine/threonine-protein kinase